MKDIDPTLPGDQAVPAAVYLLQRRDGLRFKIGWALDPLVRVQRLPEFSIDALDLVGSHAVWLPTALRAQQFERALHRGLAFYSVSPGHALDGHTEWFLPAAHLTAIRLIRQMPVGANDRLPPAIVPFLCEPGDRLMDRAGEGGSAAMLIAQDTLWLMEDLLLRVAACCQVAVESVGDQHDIRLKGFRGQANGALETLRWSVLDIERYRWRTHDHAGAFVSLIVYQGDDLVLRLTPMRHVRAWIDGTLVWQLLALLERLRELGAAPLAVRRSGRDAKTVHQPFGARRGARRAKR